MVVRFHLAAQNFKKKNMEPFVTFYVVCLAYCFFMAGRRWNRDVQDGGLGVTPALDSIAIVILAPVLAPVDLFLTWKRLYTEAKKDKRSY